MAKSVMNECDSCEFAWIVLWKKKGKKEGKRLK